MNQTLKKWLGEKQGEICVSHLIKHRFDAHFVQNAREAVELIVKIAKDYETFGFGGSNTLDQIGIKDVLSDLGKTLFDHNREDLPMETRLEFRKKQMACDCFMCSANALSLTGEIVNIDGIGNRVNAMTFGPTKVIVVAGVNKIAPDVESAIRRIKDVAAPMRAKSLNVDTPCALTGRCTDCNSPMRICSVTSILHRKPILTDISVIVVNEELGF
jgi:L-lactate utilization protein LutB